ncbi:Patatin-like phospholipase domain-containing protein 2 [Merluccius polli]|uniref:triacylglycerol lipase n=1 Tax=Merluccius polli TaxID=89951 RepID=A0AA47MKT4_MERPO|nr:Patatin-like phospholipase domain-containing protein 2 [Merluccius polli]
MLWRSMERQAGCLNTQEMFNGEEWNISFAGCGFSSLYYLGALSCILRNAPELVQRASKICGASSGCLVAASLAVGIPIGEFEENMVGRKFVKFIDTNAELCVCVSPPSPCAETCCEYLMSTALAARKYKLSVLHPSFSLLRVVQDSLHRYLPHDAHLCASGRLCVSLTRVSDGENVLVTEFDSREELIQVLLCSCFFPVYCGLIPPSYRGVRYMDGALSNNIPLFDQRNTIIVSPFSGEADICPREGNLAVLAMHYGNLGIQVSSGNVDRIYRSFFPPEPEKLAEMSHNGYMDALLFLRENGEILFNSELGSSCLFSKIMNMEIKLLLVNESQKTQEKDKSLALNVSKMSHQEDHWWLEQDVAQTLPASIQQVLCKACRESHAASSQGMAPTLVNLLSFLLIPFTWSVALIVSLTSVMLSGCKLICSLMTLSGEKHGQIWGHRAKHARSSDPDQSSIIHLPLDQEVRKWSCTDRRKKP